MPEGRTEVEIAGVREQITPPTEVASIALVWSPAYAAALASEDREAIKELAKRSGMSMSDYVTHCCLGRQVVVIDGLKDVLKELKSIGRNLNQLVTLAHMGRITAIYLDDVLRAFSELSDAVRMLLERR